MYLFVYRREYKMDIIFKILKYLKKYSNLIKSVIMIALVVFCIVQTVQISNYKSSYKEELKAGSVLKAEIEDLEKVSKNYEESIQIKEEQIIALEEEIKELKKTNLGLTSARSSTFVKDGNYDQAQMVWDGLKKLGLNDYVCAGILGNIMAEVGGQTLDISKWPVYSQDTYYGICQWSNGRKQRLLNDFGTTLNDQIRFLSVELFEVIPKDNSFYNMQDEREAALYFAKYYERCSSKYYTVRQKNATKALEYFTK